MSVQQVGGSLRRLVHCHVPTCTRWTSKPWEHVSCIQSTNLHEISILHERWIEMGFMGLLVIFCRYDSWDNIHATMRQAVMIWHTSKVIGSPIFWNMLWQDKHFEFTEVQEQNSWKQLPGLQWSEGDDQLLHFHHADGIHFCHRFLLHICSAGAANVLTLACADFQGWERVWCRLNFTVKIYQKGTHLCFYLFASFTSVPLHFLVLVSLVKSNPFRLSSCKRLLINLVAHDFRMKLMVLLIQGAVSCILVDIIVYRKMRNHLFSFFRLIQRIIHDHSLLDGVAYVIPCNITLQYIDMAYRLVEI